MAPAVLSAIPERVPRHSLVARAFHWVMAISMFALLIHGVSAQGGRQIRLGHVSLDRRPGADRIRSLFHIVHASFFLDFWSIWPDKIDLRDAKRRMMRAFGKDAPPPDRFAKYPLENKFYHAVILLAGLAVIITGVFMMKRVNTGIFVRNPYLFGDMTWGMMYVLHGIGRRGVDCADHGPCVFRNPAGEAADYEVDDFWLHGKGFLFGRARSTSDGQLKESSPTKEGPGLATGDD